MDTAAMRPIDQGNPGRVDYHTPYPVAKGVRDYVAVLKVLSSLEAIS